MKKYYVCATTYFCYDWHDWSERVSYLGDEKNAYELASYEEAREAIIDDILEWTQTPARKEDIKKEFLENGKADIPIFIYEGRNNLANLHVVTTNKTLIETSVEDQFVSHVSYWIHGIEEEKVRYLPVRRYICFPKVTPSVDRTVFQYTNSFEKANKMVFPKYMEKLGGFARYEDYVAILDEKYIKDNEWYRRQLSEAKRLSDVAEKQYGEEKAFELYHPYLPVKK